MQPVSEMWAAADGTELRASMSRLVSDSNATTEIARIYRSDRDPVVITSSDQETAGSPAAAHRSLAVQ